MKETEDRESAIKAICDKYRAFSQNIIREKIKNFIGRKFVFDQFDSFYKENQNGYFIITGDPGIGKSSIAAKIVNEYKNVSHFIERKSMNTQLHFYKNICSQLILLYNLPYEKLPSDSQLEVSFLVKLLHEIVGKLSPSEQVLIVIDALDELDIGRNEVGNILNLPLHLPEKVFVVVTTRRGTNLRIESPSKFINIEQDSLQNLKDIQDYLRGKLSDSRLKEFIDKMDLNKDVFVHVLSEKSQGNFMYLKLVVEEIASGDYKDLDIRSLPVGLENYYEDHWERMKMREGWMEYRLPILATITVVNHPISIKEIIEFRNFNNSELIAPKLIGLSIEEWLEFLYSERRKYKDQEVTAYRLYHNSYRDFINKKNSIQAEQINLEKVDDSFDEFLIESLKNDFLD